MNATYCNGKLKRCKIMGKYVRYCDGRPEYSTERRQERGGTERSMKRTGYLKLMTLITVLVFVIISCIPALAQEEQTAEKSVIILLDTSGSMKTNDPDRLVLDSITQLIYTLPSNYGMGMVSYGSEASLLCGVREIGVTDAETTYTEMTAAETAGSRHRDAIAELAAGVEYKGYSNAGAGLSRAVEALEGAAGEEKYIVMFSDGEILMKEEEDTQASLQLYQDAAKRAGEQGITIYIVGLGEGMEDPDNDIFRAAATTGGKSWYVAGAVELQNEIDRILEEMGVKQSTIAIIDPDGGQERVALELPYLLADRVRVLLTSDAPIRNLNSSFQAQSARQINGSRYSLLEIERPTGGHLEISFEAQQGNQVRINAIPEYSITPRVEISYEDRLSDEPENPYYQRIATISYSFCSMERPAMLLWEDAFFDQGKIRLGIGGETEELYLRSGRLKQRENVESAEEYEVSFDYSELPVNVIRGDRVVVTLDPPPPVPVEEPQAPEFPAGAVAAGILILTSILVAGILILRGKRTKPAPAPDRERPQPSKYSYVGKVNLYITRTRSGYDIPPLYYNLFRLPAGKVVSLQEILDECQVKEEFPGAKGIYFKPGMNRNLILTNNSDCTIMKSREILMKDKSYQLSLDAKLDISFEDEISELTLQYKDLKPGEAWQ